ncbi:hypothetical protein QUF72_07935 [Desulfobacterales bacterium HSG2]|nr:hypothetical protein [Desulfobacterales bacterium HSG2]
MKCPECDHNQKYVDGMTCGSCGYRFALNPKETPKLTDIAIRKMIDRVSGEGEYYFTYNQLLAQIHRRFAGPAYGCAGCLGILIFLIILVPAEFLLIGYFTADLTTVVVVTSVMLILPIAVCLYITRRFRIGPGVSISEARGKINTCHSVHPIKKMVDGKAFENLKSEEFDEEIFQYAPDRILIVERNDIADMLLLNRFHLENKTLVVSEEKYPLRAFRACREYLSLYPDMEVALMHDASEKGLGMKKRILSDPNWNLEEKNVRDLGLFPEDLVHLKTPMWIPKKMALEKILPKGDPMENIRKGYTMPFDVAPAKAMMGTMVLAVTLGVALLSEELLAEREDKDNGGGGFG